MAEALHERPVELLRRLIRFDTTNPPGAERECIAWIDAELSSAGIETRTLARDPERPNLVARLPGRGDAPPLLLQGHVDVVTTEGQDWTHPPFGAELDGGYVWGRGALDMKGGVAMMLAALLRARAEGLTPAGDVILAAMADEEALGTYGAHFLVDEHPELFEGVRYALGEFGGFTLHAAGKRFYPVQVSEKQACSIELTVRGPGGHGALPMRGGTMARVAEVLGRLDSNRLPVHVTPIARMQLERMSAELPGPLGLAMRALLTPALTDRVLGLMGERGKLVDPLLHNTVNATGLRGGEKLNVVPSEVKIGLDGRVLPGLGRDDLVRELRELLGEEVGIEVLKWEPGGSAEPDMGLWEVLEGVLRDADPGCVPVPLLLAGVTDGRVFGKLGIQTYGFLPMKLPEDFEFMSLIHAADERIPADAVEFGADAVFRALERYR